MPPLPKPSAVAEIAGEAYSAPWRWIAGDVHVSDRWLDGYRIIAFRGTTRNGEDILRDVRCFPYWSLRLGFVPSGFYKGVRAVIDEILIDIADDLKVGRVIVAGHSLGGSLALVMAAWLVSLGHPPAAVYAFEPAKCGGLKMRKLWRKIPLVFVSRDGSDQVPIVPLFYLLPPNITHIGRASLEWWVDHRIAVVIEDLKLARY